MDKREKEWGGGEERKRKKNAKLGGLGVKSGGHRSTA